MVQDEVEVIRILARVNLRVDQLLMTRRSGLLRCTSRARSPTHPVFATTHSMAAFPRTSGWYCLQRKDVGEVERFSDLGSLVSISSQRRYDASRWRCPPELVLAGRCLETRSKTGLLKAIDRREGCSWNRQMCSCSCRRRSGRF